MRFLKRNFMAITSVFLLMIFLSLACASAGKLTGTVPDNYSEVVEISGSKDSIYTKANLVFVDLFNNAESVIQFSDKEAGVVKGKYGPTSLSMGLDSYRVYSIIQVDAKDGKYRISMTLSDIKWYNSWNSSWNNLNPTDPILTAMNDEWKKLALVFKEKMNTNTSW